MLRDLIKTILASNEAKRMGLGDLSITLACDGSEGIQRIHESVADNRPFDLIITDLRMPKADGLRLATIARLESPESRVILTTGTPHDDPGAVVEEYSLAKYLLKPYTPQGLLGAVKETLFPSAAFAV